MYPGGSHCILGSVLGAVTEGRSILGLSDRGGVRGLGHLNLRHR